MTTQKMIKAIIVDDEPLARDVIKTLLEDHDGIEIVVECSNGKLAVDSIIQHQPDIVFLDVEMPDMNGFEVIQTLNANEMPLIIFTTAYDQYAIPAFEANALDYLLKPFDRERFNDSLDRAKKRLSLMGKGEFSATIASLLDDYETLKSKGSARYVDKVTVRQKNKIRLIKTEHIRWIEASGDYVCIHSLNDKYLLNDSMNQMAEKLDPKRFMRIHRSTIVNIDEILEIEPYFNGEYFIHLKDKTKLKSSRSYKEAISGLIK